MTNVEDYWLGPTYEFRAGDWLLVAGVPAEEGRLEWLLRHFEDGNEDVSHSFMLDPHATSDDLESALGELPRDVIEELVRAVAAQVDPALLSHAGEEDGLA